VKILLKIVLVLFILWVCAVLASIVGGVAGALAAVLLHASPFAITLIVRVFGTLFFFGVVLLAWVIYSHRRARKLARKNSVA
jgi:hypothetical protein